MKKNRKLGSALLLGGAIGWAGLAHAASNFLCDRSARQVHEIDLSENEFLNRHHLHAQYLQIDQFVKDSLPHDPAREKILFRGQDKLTEHVYSSAARKGGIEGSKRALEKKIDFVTRYPGGYGDPIEDVVMNFAEGGTLDSPCIGLTTHIDTAMGDVVDGNFNPRYIYVFVVPKDLPHSVNRNWKIDPDYPRNILIGRQREDEHILFHDATPYVRAIYDLQERRFLNPLPAALPKP